MNRSVKPAVSLSKIPSVKELCELLGFQHASLKDTNTFMEVTRAWRKSYQTTSGRPATELLLWNQWSDQLDLEEMAQKFVDDNGNGERFWSPDRSWNHDSDLQFPEDRARIVALLKQLFWKQNRYAFNNSQYAHKGPELRDGSREKTTPARQVSHDGASPALIDSMQGETSTTHGKIISPRNHTRPTDLDGKALQPHEIKGPSIGETHNVPPDIFDVPDSDDEDLIIPNSRKRPPTNTRNTPRKKKKSQFPESPRRTDRKRTARTVPHTVPSDQVEHLMYEQTEIDIPILNFLSSATHDPSLPAAQKNPQLTATIAQPDKKAPIGVSPPTDRYAAPTAPMIGSTVHETISPLLDTSSTGGVASRSEQNKKRLLASPRNKSTTTARKSELQERLLLLGAAREVKNMETLNARKAHVSPSAQPSRQNKVDPLSAATSKTPDATNLSSVEGRRYPTVPSRFLGVTHIVESDDEDGPRLGNYEEVEKKVTPALERLPLNSDLPPSLQPATGIEPPDPRIRALPRGRSIQPKSLHDSERLNHDQSNDDCEKFLATTYPLRRNSIPEDISTKPMPAPGSPPEPPRQSIALSRPSPPQPHSSKPRQKTLIPLWIITREPRYTEERWDDGKFMGTALPTFIEGISKVTGRSHIEKIKLTLRAPTFDTKITVFKDAEDSWASAKETFVEKLKEAKAEARIRRQMEPVAFKILVEPFYEEGMLPSGSIDEDDEEFDF